MKDGKSLNIVLGGRGGQGILFATAVLERTAMDLGFDVLGSETHGMAQRGGSVISHLKVGRNLGPLVGAGEGDLLLSLEKTETYRNLPFLKRGGAVLANFPPSAEVDPRIRAYLEETDITFFDLDADGIARGLGSLQASNVALLGLMAAWPASPFPEAAMRAALGKTGAERFREKNLEVFEAGLNAAKEKHFRSGTE
ncbi:MAG: indolepyruvate oxidoreductase subunit beta [Planctomycetota bacterium]|jgi:indolepyruvate ferredoxin oxidoreductase beta subunit